MAFHNVPPNGFPDLPDVEELEAVEKDVATLKTTTAEQGEAITALGTSITGLGTSKAAKADIAPTFSAESNYAVGDLVYYEGVLYECTTEHEAAAWDAEDFTATSIDEELNAINSNIVNATKTEDIASQFTLSEKVSHFQAVKRNNVVCITVRTSNEAHSGTETLVTIPQSLLPSIGEYAPVFDFSTDVLITGAAGLLTISESKIICAGSYTGRGTMSFTYII